MTRMLQTQAWHLSSHSKAPDLPKKQNTANLKDKAVVKHVPQQYLMRNEKHVTGIQPGADKSDCANRETEVLKQVLMKDTSLLKDFSSQLLDRDYQLACKDIH